MKKNQLIYKVDNKDIYIEFFKKNIIHVYLSEENKTDLIEINRLIDDSFSIKGIKNEFDYLDYHIVFDNGDLIIQNKNVNLVKISFKNNDTILTFVNDYKVFGLGDKMSYLDKKGYEYRSWCTDDPSHQDEQYKSLYKSVNYLLFNTNKKYFSFFFPSTYPYNYNLGKKYSDKVIITNENVNQDFYLFLGDDIKEITSNYSSFVGYPYFIRYKMLGYNQSRWTYKSQEEVYQLVNDFEKNDIPLDYIHLDINYMDGFRNLTIDKNNYPEFAKMAQDIKNKGIDLVVIYDAGDKVDTNYEIYNYLSKNKLVATKDKKEYQNTVWPGASVFPNYFNSKTRAYKNKMIKKFIEKYNISGIWCDMNEPASFNGELPLDVDFSYENRKLDNLEGHNVYGEHMVKDIGKIFMDKCQRPYVFSRSAFATTAKYSFFWNGDNASLWHHLKLSIPQILSMNLSNLMFNGVDVGGFNNDTTKQLLMRWIEAGVFYPFLRNHTSIDTTHQEPFSFDKEATDVYRKMLRIRYTFMPYLYNQAYLMNHKGILFNAPLFYYYPNDEEAFKYNDEYFVGENVLVAPIVDKDVDKRIVYFPEGTWKDYLTGKEYIGNKEYIISMPLDTTGIFIKKNSIIPMTKISNHLDKEKTDTLILSIYGDEAKTEIYDDDGFSLDYIKGVFNIYKVEYKNKILSFNTINNKYYPSYKTIIICDFVNGKNITIPFESSFTINF